MALLGSAQIQQAINDGTIICHPFTPEHMVGNAVALSLGATFYRATSSNQRTIYNPFDTHDIGRYFDGPYTALPYTQWCELQGLKPGHGIPHDHPVISLAPGERIIAHTHEFVGVQHTAAYQIHGTSDWAGNGLFVNVSAVWQSTAPNRVVLQLHNLNQYETIVLPVGERIAQVSFYSYPDVDETAGYSFDLDTIIKTWSPDMLLPKTYLTKPQLPPEIKGLPT